MISAEKASNQQPEAGDCPEVSGVRPHPAFFTAEAQRTPRVHRRSYCPLRPLCLCGEMWIITSPKGLTAPEYVIHCTCREERGTCLYVGRWSAKGAARFRLPPSIPGRSSRFSQRWSGPVRPRHSIPDLGGPFSGMSGGCLLTRPRGLCTPGGAKRRCPSPDR